MTEQSIRRAIKRAVASGNWMIRADRGGESYGGFKWPPVGVWIECPNWDPTPVCGGGFHGQGAEASGALVINGPKDKPARCLFCETRGERVIIEGDKLKVPEARILLVNDLSVARGLSVGGYLYLRGCTGLTVLPEGLSVGGYLDLEGCTGLTVLPEGLSVGGSLYLRGCTEELIADARSKGLTFYV
jgi:hypothetical protein